MADAPRPAIPALQAKSRPKQMKRPKKKRAPFLPADPHPHGWLTKHHLHASPKR